MSLCVCTIFSQISWHPWGDSPQRAFPTHETRCCWSIKTEKCKLITETQSGNCWESKNVKEKRYREMKRETFRRKLILLTQRKGPRIFSKKHCLLCSQFDKWEHIVLPVQTALIDASSGWRNGTHTVTTGFLPRRTCWCWSRLKQMFPVKLWISPQREYQRPQSHQVTLKTRGLHATEFLLSPRYHLLVSNP